MNPMGNGRPIDYFFKYRTFRYRIYDEDPQDRIQKRVKMHYEKQHTLQTVDFVKGMVGDYRILIPSIDCSTRNGWDSVMPI